LSSRIRERQLQALVALVEEWNNRCERRRRELGGRTVEQVVKDLAAGRLK
jgi:hypothetical protein